MVFLSLEETFLLHERIIQQSGGSSGVRNRADVESALLQPFATFDGQELYPTLVEKAALAGYLLICNHPFMDGNKRIGHAVMEVILVLNGFELVADVDEQENIILRVAEGMLTRQQFTDWVNSMVVRL
ncbi:type II toxin-antitoxin system death-on-curing family toxin [Spirosoma rhododendri]|uniref:Type II toxin-antitoxin system death-on-curing family toxin n=1 Tax=Spirosoma rhododendri TaxID=2728024 RepID=A0A7L5DQM6_9BACT|nr:type II toxin-antitoxin system death-on-curing family toxin [Spirosoma rhododendri]QJD79902.1 type II toxin-antitoxin system death-on-curing family toxin [Spirosoma rhododendri]